MIVREAVHEQHLGAFAQDDNVELDIVDPHPAAVDCARCHFNGATV
jgi:hypothetical protein